MRNVIIRDTVTISSKHMHKTQLYIPNNDNDMMDRISKKTGISKSEIVRKAISEYLQKYDKSKLEEGFGLWKNHKINLRGMRDEWNR